MLSVICRDLAVYRLYAHAGRITETQDKLRDEAIRYLRNVADGTLSIGDEIAGDQIETSPGVVIDEGPDRVMTRDKLRSF